MNTRSKIEFIVNYLLRTKPGLFLMGGVILLLSGYLVGNGYLVNIGWVFILFAIIAAVILEVQVWAWKKADKRHDGAFTSSKAHCTGRQSADPTFSATLSLFKIEDGATVETMST